MKKIAILITLFSMSSFFFCSEKETATPLISSQYNPTLPVIWEVGHVSFGMQGVQEKTDGTTIAIEYSEEIDYANDRLLATIERNKNKKEKID